MVIDAAALMPRDVVAVTGADAATYLQGQISQDVEAVAEGSSAWSLVLAPQGKVDAWFRLTRGEENTFLLDTEAGFGPALVARLERFRLRTDVAFEMLEGWQMLALRGPMSAEERLDGVDAQVQVRAVVDWPGYEGVDLLGPQVAELVGLEAIAAAGLPEEPAGLAVTRADGLAALSESLGAAGVDGLEVARIRAGWPAMGRELTERTIPAEIGGLVEASVSFTKGCYTGQELVARIDSRGGNVPRPVRLLEIDADAVAPGAEITVDGKAVGEITSAALDSAAGVTVALGPVHRRVAPPAEAEVAGVPAVVLATPAS